MKTRQAYLPLLFVLVVGCGPQQAEPMHPVGPEKNTNVGEKVKPTERPGLPGTAHDGVAADAKPGTAIPSPSKATSAQDAGQAPKASVVKPAYNKSADAKADIASAIKAGQSENLPVLIVFGADWCGDCRKLDAALQSGPIAAIVKCSFKVVKVYVGQFDTNTDVAEQYGVPLRKGIPTIAVLSAKGEVLYTTKSGELANARKMGDEGLLAFFSQLAAKTKQ